MTKYNVKWLVEDKRCIKFNEEDEAFQIAENVKLEGITTGVKVEVTIEDNIVTALNVIADKKEEKIVEQKMEETPVEKEVVAKEPVVVTWTVQGITSDKKVIKFEEQPKSKYWYPIKENIRESFDNVKKGCVITVKIAEVETESKEGKKYMKDGIVGIKKDEIVVPEDKQPETETVNDAETVTVEKEVQQEEKIDTYKPSTGTNDSIERQVALKSAIDMLKIQCEVDKVVMSEANANEFIKHFTKVCLDAMRNA